MITIKHKFSEMELKISQKIFNENSNILSPITHANKMILRNKLFS